MARCYHPHLALAGEATVIQPFTAARTARGSARGRHRAARQHVTESAVRLSVRAQHGALTASDLYLHVEYCPGLLTVYSVTQLLRLALVLAQR